ncbi:MAG TPA: MBL fold metallo-hydrolase [Terriglobales bacterium]|nr:MBL fold metallo-hydrolase [Terriglobales bacterium]
MAQVAVDLAVEKATITTNGRRITVGDFELTMFSDGNYWLDGGPLFGIIPRALWSKKVACDEKNRVVLGLNSLLIRGGKQTVLVETGIGNKFDDRVRKVYEPEARLLGNLTAAGVAPDSIDIVINTHLHFDHCGWNTVRTNGHVVPTFPRAIYYAPEGEWQHGQKQYLRDRVSYISDNYNPLIESGQMKLVKEDRKIIPGVSVRTIPGHTRYMQVVMIESQGQKACYVSDLIPTAIHLDLLWIMAYDLFPIEIIENKKRFYDEAIPGRWLVIFTHDPAIPWGYVKEMGTGKYGVEPIGIT